MPTTYPLDNSASGNLTTINAWLKDPLAIPEAFLAMTDQTLIPEAVLRPGGISPTGVVKYKEATPRFAKDKPQIREEFDSPVIMRVDRGQEYVVSCEELAGSVLISEEMQRRQILDPLNAELTAAVNTYQQTWSDRFRNTIFNHPRVQTLSVANVWDSTNSTTRADIIEAKRLIKTATPDGMDNYSRYGYKPDTLIIGEDAEAGLLESDEFSKIYQGNIADQNLQYTGVLPNKLFGLDVLVDTFMPPGKAIMLQRKVAGAWVDELPFRVEPTHEWVDHYAWRSNFRRSSVCFLDNPKAVCVLNGVS